MPSLQLEVVVDRQRGRVTRTQLAQIAAVVPLVVPALFGVLQFGPRPVLLTAWSLLGMALGTAVVIGIRHHRPNRPLPWQVLAAMVFLHSPTTAAFVLRDAGWLPTDVGNVAVGVFALIGCVLAPAAYAFLLPPGFWRRERRAIVVLLVSGGLALATAAWRIAERLSSGTRIAGDTVLRAEELLWVVAVGLLMAGLHLLRCARTGRWSEAALTLFPVAVAAAYLPLAAGIDVETGDRVVIVGVSFAYALVAAAALHPTMRMVARDAPTHPTRIPLRPLIALLAVNVIAAPLVIGAVDHPWMVPLYAVAAGGCAMWWSIHASALAGIDRLDPGPVGGSVTAPPAAVADWLAGAAGDELRAAVAGGSLALHYQPVIDLDLGTVVGVEALLRWHHPTLGWLLPQVVLPLAARVELADELTDWTLSRLVEESPALLGDLGGPAPYVALNVAPSQLERPGFVDLVASRLRDGALPASALLLEITEHEAFADLERGTTAVGRLQQLGVRLAMDDFGSGNANLPLLARLEIDVVKLDRSVVSGIGNPRGARVLATMVDLLDDLDVRIVAEGVETPATVGALRQLGVRAGQGFAFTPALPLEELTGWVRERAARPRSC